MVKTILRTLPSQVVPSLPSIPNKFTSSTRVPTIVDICNEDGEIIAKRKSTEVVVRELSDKDFIRQDTADLYDLETCLQTGLNIQEISTPYFRQGLDSSTAMFSLLNKEGLIETQSLDPQPTQPTQPTE